MRHRPPLRVVAVGGAEPLAQADQLDGGALASMAVSGGAIFIRTDTHLYRIGKTS